MPQNNISVRLAIKKQKVREELEEVISSTIGFYLPKSNPPEYCDLLILEIGDNPEKDFHMIHSIQDSGVAREIFLTSSHFEPDLLLQSLRTGIKEFFPQPIKSEEVKEALLKLKEQREKVKFGREKKKRGKIIDVIGSKGGVGTTTIAVNLASSLKELDKSPSVALIDMNLLFGEIPIFLNIESAFNWGEVAKNISRLDSTYLMSILFKHSSGVYVLPSPNGLDGDNVTSPEIIGKLLSLMQNVFDFIVIDGGQSLDDISLKILEMSDIVLLIGVLSLPCLTNIKKLLWTFQRLGYPQKENIKIIINRNHKKSVISSKDAEKSIDKKIFWFLPNDYPITITAINQGKTVSTIAHRSEISKNIKEFASVLSEKEKWKSEL